MIRREEPTYWLAGRHGFSCKNKVQRQTQEVGSWYVTSKMLDCNRVSAAASTVRLISSFPGRPW
jgi:hypothetical protein